MSTTLERRKQISVQRNAARAAHLKTSAQIRAEAQEAAARSRAARQAQEEQQKAKISAAADNVNPLLRGLSTSWRVQNKLITGALGAVEGIVDLGIGAIGAVGGLVSEDFREGAKQAVAYDATNEWVGKHLDELTKYSYTEGNKAGEIVENVASGVGQMLPAVIATVATGGGTAPTLAASASKLGMGVTIASAAGNATQQAYNDGADYYEGLAYGAASGAVEGVTEKLTGGVANKLTGFGKGIIKDSAGKVASQGIKRVAKEAVGEGAEEAIAEFVNPALKAIYKGKDAINEYGESEYWQGVGESALVGALTSVAFGQTVGRATGGNADINASLEAIKEIDDSFYTGDSLNENVRVQMHTNVGKNLENVEKVLKKTSAEKRAKLIEQYQLGNIFDESGSMRTEFSSENGFKIPNSMVENADKVNNIVKENTSLDKNSAVQYNRKQQKVIKAKYSHDDFATNAMQWANKTTTVQGSKKVFYNFKTETYDMVVADSFADVGYRIEKKIYDIPENDSLIKQIMEEAQNENNRREQTNSESLYKDIGGYQYERTLRGNDNSNAARFRSDGQGGGIYRGESSSHGNRNSGKGNGNSGNLGRVKPTSWHFNDDGTASVTYSDGSKKLQYSHKAATPDSSMRMEFSSENGFKITEGQTDVQNTNASPAAFSAYQSPSLSLQSNKVKNDLSAITEELRRKDIENGGTGQIANVEIYDGELSENAKAEYGKFKKGFHTLNKKMGGGLSFALVKPNSSFNGVRIGNTVYISADNLSDGAWKKTLIHEVTHATEGTKAYAKYMSFLGKDENLVYEAMDTIVNQKPDYGFTDELADRVVEKMDVEDSLQKPSKKHIAGVSQDNGQYSLNYTTDNKAVAVIENDIFDGKFNELSDSERIKIVKNAIKGFRPGVPVSGRLIGITRKTAGHFTNSDYTDKVRNNNPQIYEDKLNLAQNIDDVIYASTDYINEELKHQRNDNIEQFARGTVLLDIGGNKYKADVLVGYTSMKDMILYDVQDLTPTNFTLKEKKTQPKLAGNKSYTRKTVEPSSVNSIPEVEEIVKDLGEKYFTDEERSFLSELNAHMTEKLLGEDEVFIEKLVRGNSTVAEKTLNMIAEAKRAVASLQSSDTRAKYNRLRRAEKLYLKAVSAAGMTYRNGKITRREEENKYSLVTEKSAEQGVSKKFSEFAISTALYDSLDHKDSGDDNLIRVSRMPRYVVENFGIDGDFYIYRDHAYENMVSMEQAKEDGRPIRRGGKDIRFHDLGVERMTEAILSLNDPIMTVKVKSKDGNPTVVMMLPVEGDNGAPLYAVLSFYSDRPINGRFEQKPHIVLTVAPRELFEPEGGRQGWAEFISEAVKENRVLDYNKKGGYDLSVIAQQARLGNITEASLKNNIAQFRQEVNSFKQKNKISYSRKATPKSENERVMKQISDEIRQEIVPERAKETTNMVSKPSSKLIGNAKVLSKKDVKNAVANYNIKSINDYVSVQKRIIETLTQEGFFDNNIVVNEDSDMIIEITKDGVRETLGVGNRFQTLPRTLKELKIATIRELPEFIKTAHLEQDNVHNTHNAQSKVKYAYLSNVIEVVEDEQKYYYNISIAVRKSPQKNKFWIHELRIKENEQDLSSSGDIYPQQEYNKALALDKRISQDDEKVNPKIQFSRKKSDKDIIRSQQQKIERRDNRIEKQREVIKEQKATIKNSSQINELCNRCIYLVNQIRDLKSGKYIAASEYQNHAFKEGFEKLSKLLWRGNLRNDGAVRAELKKLYDWYVNPKNRLFHDESGNKTEDFNHVLVNTLEELGSGEGALTLKELEALAKTLEAVKHHIDTYNKVWNGKRWVNARDEGERFVRSIERNKEYRTGWYYRFFASGKYQRMFADNASVFRAADCYDEHGFFTEYFEAFREGLIGTQVAEMELREEVERFYKKHKTYVKRLTKEKITYKEKEMTVAQYLSLYMTTKRKQSCLAFAETGFMLRDAQGNAVDFGPLATDPASVATEEQAEAYVEKMRKELEQKLTKEDLEYVAILEKVYVECSKIKSNTDMIRWGYSNVISSYYYPNRKADTAENVDESFFVEVDRTSDLSFNKSTVKNAGRLFIEPVDTVFNRHVRGIALYSNLAMTVENMNRVLNVNVSDSQQSNSLVRHIKGNKYLRDTLDALKKLKNDIEGMRIVEDAELSRFIGKLRSNYARSALAANPKIFLTQLSSFFAATGILKYQNMVKGFSVPNKSAEVDKYCSLAKLRNTDNTVVKAQTVSDKTGKVSDVLLTFVGKIDRWVVVELFGGCQVQIEAEGGAKVGTEANKIEAGKLLERVILETQQNTLLTEKSAAMRSSQEYLKFLTMFSADAMKVMGRVYDGMGEVTVLKAKSRAHKANPNKNAATIAALQKERDGVTEELKKKREEQENTYNTDFANKTVDSFGIKKPGDYIHVQKQVFDTLLNEGFFTDSERRSRTDVNEETGMVIETNKKGVFETFSLNTYGRLGKAKKIAKLATIRQLPDAIKYGSVIADNMRNTHHDGDNKTFAYIEYPTVVDGKTVVIKLAIKKSPQKNKFWVHSIYDIENVSDSSTSTPRGTEADHITADTGNIISQDFGSVKSENENQIADLENRIAALDGQIEELKKEPAQTEKKLKQAKKKLARSAAALTASSVFMAAIALFFKWLYGKTMDKEKEDIAKDTVFDLIGNMLGGLPLVRDIYSAIAEGFDVDVFNMSVLNDFLDSCRECYELAAMAASGDEVTDTDIRSAIKKTLSAVGMIFGVPVRNTYNLVTGLTKRISPSSGYWIESQFYSQSYSSDLKEAIEKDDEKMISTIAGLITGENFDGVGKAAQSSVRELVSKGYTGVLPRSVGDSVTYDGEEIELSARQKKRFREIYGIADESVEILVSLSEYREADDEVKAKAIKFISDTYYGLALEELVGAENSKLTLFAEVFDIEKLALIISTARTLEADKDKNGKVIQGSKKAKIIKYLESLRMSAAQKHMLLGYLGYSQTKGREKVEAYIGTLRLTKDEKIALLEHSGYAVA